MWKLKKDGREGYAPPNYTFKNVQRTSVRLLTFWHIMVFVRSQPTCKLRLHESFILAANTENAVGEVGHL